MDKIQKIVYELDSKGFFKDFKIRPFFHNREISDIGNPLTRTWSEFYDGYRLMGGRMSNPDTYVRFKLRGCNLIILRFDTDNYSDHTYLGTVNLPKAGVLTGIEDIYREKRLKKLLK